MYFISLFSCFSLCNNYQVQYVSTLSRYRRRGGDGQGRAAAARWAVLNNSLHNDGKYRASAFKTCTFYTEVSVIIFKINAGKTFHICIWSRVWESYKRLLAIEYVITTFYVCLSDNMKRVDIGCNTIKKF